MSFTSGSRCCLAFFILVVCGLGEVPAQAQTAASNREKIEKLLRTGTAEELDKVFVPIEYSTRNQPKSPPPPSREEFAWQAEILKKRLKDKDPAVRTVALRILSALSPEMAVVWASAHLEGAKGRELIACIHVLLGVHTGTETMDGAFLLGHELSGAKAHAAIMKRVEKPDFRLQDVSSFGLRKLLAVPRLSENLRNRTREAIRKRACEVRDSGTRGIQERIEAMDLLNPLVKDDLDALEKAAAARNPRLSRAAALRRIGAALGKSKRVSEIGKRHMADSEKVVRAAAAGLVPTEERFRWYLGLLAAKKKDAARVVVEHLGASGEVEDILRQPDKYPFISEFTLEEVSWLEDAGLHKDIAGRWKPLAKIREHRESSALESRNKYSGDVNTRPGQADVHDSAIPGLVILAVGVLVAIVAILVTLRCVRKARSR